MDKYHEEKQELEKKNAEKEKELQKAYLEAKSSENLARDYSNALMKAGRNENLLEEHVKKLKVERDQLQSLVGKLKQVENHVHDAAEEVNSNPIIKLPWKTFILVKCDVSLD